MSGRCLTEKCSAESPSVVSSAPSIDLLWWSAAHGAAERAKEEFMALPASARGKLLKTIERYLKGDSRRQDVRPLAEGIREWRCREGNNHFRALFIRWGDACVVLTVFYKNQQRTPPQDMERARSRANAWRRSRGSSPA